MRAGLFTAARTELSRARSLAYTVLDTTGGVRITPASFTDALVDVVPFPLPPGTDVEVLFGAADESTDAPGSPGEFSQPVEDLSALPGGEYIKVH